MGIISGLILAAVGIIVWARFEMAFFGGFEENVDISVTALLLMFPSSLAGAYAGFLRSREQQSKAARQVAG